MDVVHRRLVVVLVSFAVNLMGTGATHAGQNPAFQPESVPAEATLVFPVYPSAEFITSYDAGQGQRYFLFGTQVAFEEMVQYYSVLLDENGDRVFRAPAVHIFEIGRFRDESMSYPPGVTIKDYTWNGSEGYESTTPGAGVQRFPTIIQIVPPPVGVDQ